MKTVNITVKGGVVEVDDIPKGIEVLVTDHDSETSSVWVSNDLTNPPSIQNIREIVTGFHSKIRRGLSLLTKPKRQK